MAVPTIHDIGAAAFHALTTDEQVEFLAEVAAPWVGSAEDGSTALPTTYSLLFERRVEQAAKQADVTADAMLVRILRAAGDENIQQLPVEVEAAPVTGDQPAEEAATAAA